MKNKNFNKTNAEMLTILVALSAKVVAKDLKEFKSIREKYGKQAWYPYYKEEKKGE